MTENTDTVPWKSLDYQLDVLAGELDIDFKARWFKDRVESIADVRGWDVDELDDDRAVLVCQNLRGNRLNGWQWVEAREVWHTEDGIKIEVWFDVE